MAHAIAQGYGRGLDFREIESQVPIIASGSKGIQEAGILLKLSQSTVVSAVCCLQRYNVISAHAPPKLEQVELIAGCLLVASKQTGSEHVDWSDVLTVSRHLTDSETVEFVRSSLQVEIEILGQTNFHRNAISPHIIAMDYLTTLGLLRIAQTVWNTLNDALRTPLYVLQSQNVLAAGAISHTCRKSFIALPLEWWICFDVTKTELDVFAYWIERV